MTGTSLVLTGDGSAGVTATLIDGADALDSDSGLLPPLTLITGVFAFPPLPFPFASAPATTLIAGIVDASPSSAALPAHILLLAVPPPTPLAPTGFGPARVPSACGRSPAPAAVHDRSKLTIGRPGRSLTATGVGSLALRSLSRMLVAARMSSLRISRPSRVGTGAGAGAAFSSTAVEELEEVVKEEEEE